MMRWMTGVRGRHALAGSMDGECEESTCPPLCAKCMHTSHLPILLPAPSTALLTRVHALRDAAEDGVLIVEPGRGHGGDEELRACVS